MVVQRTDIKQRNLKCIDLHLINIMFLCADIFLTLKEFVLLDKAALSHSSTMQKLTQLAHQL